MPATPITLGPLPQEQPLSYTLSRVDATTYERAWIGTKAQLDAIAFIEKQYAEAIRLVGRGSTYELIARYVNTTDGVEVPTETQELDTAPIYQSIFLNATFQELLPEEQFVIRKQFEEKPDDRATALTNINEIVPLERQTIAARAYDLMLQGTDSYENHVFILNRVRTCSRRYSGKLTLSKISSLWTTAELAAYVGNPLLFDIPDLTLSGAEQQKNLFAGWRQSVCRVSDNASGSRQLTEQWQLARWSQDLYVRQTTIP